jgi:PAS domain S-box-containing protein
VLGTSKNAAKTTSKPRKAASIMIWCLASTALVLLLSAALARARGRSNQLKRELIAVFQTTHCGVIVTGENRAIIHANHAFEDLTGRSRSEIEGHLRLDDVLDQSCMADILDHHELLSEHPNAAGRHYQARLKDKTGRTRDARVTESRIRGTRHCVMSFEDVSASKLNEWAARESLQKYLDIFENTVVGIFQTSADGRYLSANRALARIYGYDDPRDLMRNLTDIGARLYVDPERRAAFVKEMQEKGEVFDFESEIRRKDGSTIWTRENARVVHDASGAFLYYEGNVEDITRRRQFEEELRVQNARLAQALADLKAAQSKLLEQERLHVIGRMASGIAHDFNNALSPILGYAELMLKQSAALRDPDRARRYLELILSSARDAAGIVGNLRKLYRGRSHSEYFRPLDLADIVRQSIALTQPRWRNQALGQGAEIRVFCQFDDVPSMTGDEGELREAFTNLIFNAVDAMPKGGSITIGLTCEGDWIRVFFEDSGKGMPDDVRARCFEPFFTTKGERGTGLGLAMVHGIILRHGGQIEAQSEPGRFTRFNIRIPLQNKPSPAVRQDDEAPERWPRKVLCVDDEAFMLDLMRDLLEAEGSRVVVARDGNEALQAFAADKFDLVILDQGMPGMSGEVLAERLKAINPAQPVLMLTGFGDFMTAEGEQSKFVDCIVSKPIARDALRKGVADAIGAARAKVACEDDERPDGDASPSGGADFLDPAPQASSALGAVGSASQCVNAAGQSRQATDCKDGKTDADARLADAIEASQMEALDQAIREIATDSVVAVHQHLEDKAKRGA